MTTDKVIKIIVKTNSPRNKLIKVSENQYKVEIKAQAKSNKANIEIEKFLTKYFKKQTKIILGFRLRKKLVKIYS